QLVGDRRGAKSVVKHVPVQHQPDQDHRGHRQREMTQRRQIGARFDPRKRRQEQRDGERQPLVVQHHGTAQSERRGGPRGMHAGSLTGGLGGGAGSGAGQRAGQQQGDEGPTEIGLEAGDLRVGDQQRQHRNRGGQSRPMARVPRALLHPQSGGGVEGGEQRGGGDQRG